MKQIKNALYFFYSIKETSWYRTNEFIYYFPLKNNVCIWNWMNLEMIRQTQQMQTLKENKYYKEKDKHCILPEQTHLKK